MKVESQNSTVCAISVPGINDPAQTVSRTRKFTEKQTFSQRNNLRETNFLLSLTDMTQFFFSAGGVSFRSFGASTAPFQTQTSKFVPEILTFWKDVLSNVVLWCMMVCQLQLKAAKNWLRSPRFRSVSPEWRTNKSRVDINVVVCYMSTISSSDLCPGICQQCRILLEPWRTMAWLDGKV